MRSREQICSQQVHCLNCPLSVRVTGKDCRELTQKEIQKFMKEVNNMSYKPKSDSYLMQMTKAEIIAELRVAEHNFFAMEKALENSAKVGKEFADKFSKAKELLKTAVFDFKVIGKALDADCDFLINCDECPLQSGHYNCRSWNHQDEALELIGMDGEDDERPVL